MEQIAKKQFRCDIAFDECKACARCVEACPRSLLKIGTAINMMGYPSVTFAGEGCIGCGACYYCCPEPGAITIVEITPDGKE